MLTSLKRAFAVFLLLSSFTLCASAQKVFIQNVYPTFDTAGGTVTLYGRGFTNMRSLNFDNAQVAFNVLSDTVATAIAPVSCRNGIEATADDGSYSFLNFIVVPTPAQGEVYVSDFSPKYGHTGSIVTLRGRGFTGVSSVQMGGKPATSFTVVSDSVINVVANDTSIGWFEVDGTLPQANGFIPKGNVFINLDTYKDPYIISFSPRFATTGTKLTINGINFTGATGVVLPNGNPSSFTVVSPTQVVAVVGSGKTSLTTQLAVLTPNQQIYIYDSTAGPTMYPLATPVVTGFTPPSDTAGGLVTITGSNFTGTDSVFFGGVQAASFTVVSPGTILATVGNGASGAVMVHNAAGYASLNGFSYVGKNVPTLTSFWNHGIVGGQININGSNFTGATAVYFGAVPATSFRVYNDGLIFAQVPPGANNVPITVATPNGTVTSSRNFLVDPTLTSISPQTDTTGGVVTIQGYGLSTARQVYFGAVPAASFSIVNDTVIQATVGSGASGYVSVYSRLADSTSFQDTLYSQSFYFGSPLIPIINSFSPESDTLGGTVTIKGAHLTGATVVKLAGSPASSFAVISDSLITAVVGPTGNGPVTVLTPHGTATSADAFSYFGVPADIFDFYPKSDTAGQIITLTGKHLTGVWYIAVGDGWTETVNVLSDSVLQFAVPHGATSGAISIEAQGGYISSINGFVYGTMPAISSFSPVSDTARGTVTIHGYQFTGATAVSFGNTPAASYTVVSDTLIHAIVGAGSSGLVKVTTPQGSDSLAGFTYVAGPAPKIDTLYNMYGNAGQFVQIYGQNIGNATAVTFGGTPAASFQVINSGIVVARLGSGSSGWVTVTTPYGRDSFPNFWYVTGPPTLIGFYPQSATTGDTLRIVGNNLVGPTQVLLGGKPAKVIYSDPGQVNVVVRDGATGSVEFDNGYGSVAMPGFVYTGTVPSLITVTPTSDSAGKTVTLTGQRLSGATALNFGAVPAASFTVVSDSVITAIVPTGVTSHYIGVTTPGGVDSLGGFTYLGAATPPPPPVNPVIASFYPTTDTAGGTVTIHGSDFTGVNLVTFGGVPAASFTVVSDSTINAVVGNGASGSIIVFSAHGNDTTWGFTLAQSNQHSISYLSPGSDTVGGQVTITGLGFFGVSNVLFGSTPATFSVTSPTSIIATVPNGLTTGSYTLSVIMPGDTLTFNSFTVIDTIMPPAPQPQLFSFSPASDTAGGTVTLYGAHLTGASQVTFGGTPAASISVVSDSIVTAVVGQGSTGAIWLTTSGGTAKTDTLTPFTYVPKTVISPTITSFTPIIDTAGGVVTITGTNLGDVQWVYFGSTPAASFTVVSPTTITAVLGGGSTGAIQVGNSVTNAYSVDTFLFVGAKPPFAVTSFTGAMVSNQAQLTWITQYDQGVATYTLESSADSISFNQVYSVPSRHIDGAGNAYSFVDPNPVQGMNYYLLTAIDSLGNTLGTWRTTLNVPIQPQVTTLPNPASGAINIQVPYSAHTATLTLVDLNGKPVRTMTVPSGAYQARMDLTGVPGGIYVLTWQDGTNRTEKHIMVQ